MFGRSKPNNDDCGIGFEKDELGEKRGTDGNGMWGVKVLHVMVWYGPCHGDWPTSKAEKADVSHILWSSYDEI